jgi:hypothetical protein
MTRACCVGGGAFTEASDRGAGMSLTPFAEVVMGGVTVDVILELELAPSNKPILEIRV